MCDYSLEHLDSRAAKVGDQLVTTKFGRTCTTGFCAIGQPRLAVCIKPGTELAFEREIERETLFFKRGLGSQVARFRRVNQHRNWGPPRCARTPIRKGCAARASSSGPTCHGLAVAGGGTTERGGTSSILGASTHDSPFRVRIGYEKAPTLLPGLMFGNNGPLAILSK